MPFDVVDNVKYKVPKEDNIFVWSSISLKNKQLTISTYSSDAAVLLNIVDKLLDKLIKQNLTFMCDFSTPNTTNTQVILVYVDAPLFILLRVKRILVNANLTWKIDVGISDKTPNNITKKIIALTNTNPLDENHCLETYQEKIGRKVRI